MQIEDAEMRAAFRFGSAEDQRQEREALAKLRKQLAERHHAERQAKVTP